MKGIGRSLHSGRSAHTLCSQRAMATHLRYEGRQGRAAQQVGNRGPGLLWLLGRRLRQGAGEAVTGDGQQQQQQQAHHAVWKLSAMFEAIRVPRVDGGGRKRLLDRGAAASLAHVGIRFLINGGHPLADT